jgi:hypothetical protein
VEQHSASHKALRQRILCGEDQGKGSSRTASSMRQAPVADLSLPPAEPALAKLLPSCLGEIADGKHQKEACTARGRRGAAVRGHDNKQACNRSDMQWGAMTHTCGRITSPSSPALPSLLLPIQPCPWSPPPPLHLCLPRSLQETVLPLLLLDGLKQPFGDLQATAYSSHAKIPPLPPQRRIQGSNPSQIPIVK